MTVSSLVAICATVILIAVGISTFYLARALRALARLLELGEEILEDTKPQIHDVLLDVSSSTSSVRAVIVRVDKLINGFISLPDFAKTFAKQTLRAFLNKERG